MALDYRPKSLTLDTLLLIWLWSSTFGQNVLRRHSEPEDHTHTRQQNLLFSGAGPGGGLVCAVTSFAELLIDPLRNYESEVKLAGWTDKHTWSRHEREAGNRDTLKAAISELSSSDPAAPRGEVRPYHLPSPANWEALKHIWSIPFSWLQQLKKPSSQALKIHATLFTWLLAYKLLNTRVTERYGSTDCWRLRQPLPRPSSTIEWVFLKST